MKKFMIIIFFLSSCTINNEDTVNINNFDQQDILNLSIDDYKEMLKYYNDNKEYPNIEK